MMDNNDKMKVINDFEPLIKKLAYSYRIYGFTKEELIQELKTHLCDKLNQFNDNLASLPFYVELVIKNKLNNLHKSPYNKKEILKPKIYLDDEVTYDINEKIALEVAFALLRNEKDKELILDIILGDTFRAVADKHGVSRQTAHNIYTRFIEKVKGEL